MDKTLDRALCFERLYGQRAAYWHMHWVTKETFPVLRDAWRMPPFRQRLVDETTTETALVQTTFTGVDHVWRDNVPRLFETVVWVDGDWERRNSEILHPYFDYTIRSTTWRQAQLIHVVVVEQVQLWERTQG